MQGVSIGRRLLLFPPYGWFSCVPCLYQEISMVCSKIPRHNLHPPLRLPPSRGEETLLNAHWYEQGGLLNQCPIKLSKTITPVPPPLYQTYQITFTIPAFIISSSLEISFTSYPRTSRYTKAVAQIMTSWMSRFKGIFSTTSSSKG